MPNSDCVLCADEPVDSLPEARDKPTMGLGAAWMGEKLQWRTLGVAACPSFDASIADFLGPRQLKPFQQLHSSR